MPKRREMPTTTTADHFRWEFGTTTRIGLWATLASAATGILLALFQVQGWTVPTAIAIILIALLSAFIAVAAGMAVYEVVKAVRRFLEHRATSAAWVLDENPGFLDYEADGVRAMNRFNREMTKLAKDTQNLGEKMERHRRRMDRGSGWSGKRKQRLANRTAKDINKSGVFIEKRIALLKALIRDVFRNYEGLIAMAVLETQEDLAVAAGLQDVMKETRQVSDESAQSSAGYRDSVRELEKQNISRTVRIAAHRLANALDEVVNVLRQYEKRAGNLSRDLEQKMCAAR